MNYVDTITQPDSNKIPSENRDRNVVVSIEKRLEMPVVMYNSKLVCSRETS